MLIKCESCLKEFQFETENEGFWESEDYHFHELNCPHCKNKIIIKSYKTIP